MKKNYFKLASLAMGIVAVAGTANAEWSNVNGQYMKNPAFIPGWSGALTGTTDGVAEVYNGAFELYQVINDAPAGEYTLTANAFYRYTNNGDSELNMKDGKNHNAYIFIGDNKTVVEGLFDNTAATYPNDKATANEAFVAGRYVNTVKVNHKGGDLKFGIANTGGRQDEWCCFDNFKITGPNGDVAVINGDFSKELNIDANQTEWDIVNFDGDTKKPDVNKAGGVYRKTNASPYNFGTMLELPAGKYRFGVQSFMRYGDGNQKGWHTRVKSSWQRIEENSAYDNYLAGVEIPAENRGYLYVAYGTADDIKPLEASEAKYYQDKEIMSIFAENLAEWPDNEPKIDGTDEFGYGWCDSGFEYQAAKCFIANPDKYRNYVEFEIAEPQKVWVGIKVDKKFGNNDFAYWNPFRDFTIEKYVEGGSGVAEIVVDENAPVEYYNLQGIRVANPENGLYIVKQGNKVTKRIIK